MSASPQPVEQPNGPPFTSAGLSARQRWIWSGIVLFLVAVALNAHPVPYGNEYLYLLAPYRWAHPAVLRGDWSFATVFDIHRVFNAVVGVATLVVSMEVLGLVCRLLSWAVLTWLTFRLAAWFRLGPGLAAVSIAVWLITQSLYGGEWVFGGFEAKVVAYVCVFGALNAMLRGRDRAAAFLFGLAFTWHSSVGLAAGVGAAAAFLASQRPVRRLVADAAIAVAAMLPGILGILPVLGGAERDTPALWRTQVVVVTPEHMNVASFGNSAVALGFVMLAFNLAQCWAQRSNVRFRQLAWFQIGVALVTIGGLLAWAAGAFSLLKIYPFRVFPVLVPLFFLFHLSHAYATRTEQWPSRGAALLAFVSLLLFPNPLVELRSRIDNLRAEWHDVRHPDDVATLFRWVNEHTPDSSVVVSPPWRRDSFYLTRRPQIALLAAVSYGRLAEWTSRVELLVGPLDSLAGADLDEWERRYAALGVPELRLIRARFGADFFVGCATSPPLELPVVARHGAYAVYDLRGLPR